MFFHHFFSRSFSRSKCLSFPCLPYLLAWKLRHAQRVKEGSPSLCFRHSRVQLVPCVARLRHVSIVAINADWLICPAPDNQSAFSSRCGNFSAMSLPARAKSLPNDWPPLWLEVARMTARLFQLLQTLGLATGGRLGRRVTDRMGIQTTRHTLLRRIMALPTEPVGQITELGIDDFADHSWTHLWNTPGRSATSSNSRYSA